LNGILYGVIKRVIAIELIETFSETHNSLSNWLYAVFKTEEVIKRESGEFLLCF